MTQKMLAQQLKEPGADGLVHRESCNQAPPKVEYSPTDRGRGRPLRTAEGHLEKR